MWTMAMALFGLIAGYIAGLLLAAVISLGGSLIVHHAVGIPYLTYGLAVVGAIVGALIARRRPAVPHKGR